MMQTDSEPALAPQTGLRGLGRGDRFLALEGLVKRILLSLWARPQMRRYQVTPRCRTPIFRRQLLIDVLHSVKQKPID